MAASADPRSAPGSEEDEGEALTNVMVLEGPSGSGKSAAVYDCARKLGIRVIEVSASQQRSGSAVKKFIAEAAQSENIMDNMGSSLVGGPQHIEGSPAGMSLILFDEVCRR
jgi:MoxR-like ATPase